MALQDPYCAWNKLESKCVDLYDYDEDDINSNSFLQNVISGTHEGCKAGNGKSSSAESDVKFAGSRGVQLLMLRTDFVTSSVLYPATSGRVEQVCLLAHSCSQLFLKGNTYFFIFFIWSLLVRRHLFDNLLWSIFQS